MRKRRNFVMGMVGTGVMMGGGAMALGGMGGVPAGNAAQGIANASSFMPAMGTIGGAGMVMGSLKGLQGTMRTRRRKGSIL
jgi:hypothetical protein